MNTERLFKLSAVVGCPVASIVDSVLRHRSPREMVLGGVLGVPFGALASLIAWRYVAGPIARGQASRTFRLWTAVGCAVAGLAGAAIVVWTWH